jgi:hypothetical protein
MMIDVREAFRFFARLVVEALCGIHPPEVQHIQLGNPGDTKWRKTLHPAIYLGSIMDSHFWFVRDQELPVMVESNYQIALTHGSYSNGDKNRYCTNSRRYNGFDRTLEGLSIHQSWMIALEEAGDKPYASQEWSVVDGGESDDES